MVEMEVEWNWKQEDVITTKVAKLQKHMQQ